MSLKDKLFPDTNITGFTDTNNQPIMVGQKVKDENGDVWYVLEHQGKYVVSPWKDLSHPAAETIPLNLFITLSEKLTIEP